MVFKNKLSFSSSPDSSNRPRSVASNSPIRSDGTPENTFELDNPKESESPRYQALLAMTSAPPRRKRFPGDIKSFSHELDSKGERLVLIRAAFDKAKEEVNSDLAVFAADLVGVVERNAESHPEWEETFEDLLILARTCAMTPPGDFWLQCQGIVQDLDDRRQDLPPGCVLLKELHTRMLFILTRCTRLLQFRKESWGDEEEQAVQLSHPVEKQPLSEEGSSILCRICEEEVPTSHVEDHSRICTLAGGKSDQRGLSGVDELMAIAGTLDKIAESLAAAGLKVSNSTLTEECDLGGKGTFHDRDDIPQMSELADIAKRAADAIPGDEQSILSLLSCLEDLRVVIDRSKFKALTVGTFGTRIEKLIREKYLLVCELMDDEKVDKSSTVIEGAAPLEEDVVRNVHPRDRTSIYDFEIIKPISRGAFERVFLAKKRTTGDLFAIKVLKKADIIRKNAVESILAERDILINVRNPFVVRFFYSFTDRDNLYLVMENGGDLYSLLRNLGCLKEDIVRVYIAEVVLALEYLHSQGVVHLDVKPANLLIAHDGHIKLTGLSKADLINSTGDLPSPGTSLLDEEESRLQTSEHQLEMIKKRSAVGRGRGGLYKMFMAPPPAVGTPNYLAPEILLGTGHGETADWWSVGIILFELIVGIPPFNAEHPQQIFDNILNRNIPWPHVPEEMSAEAHDIIDRFLTEDPHLRLGARGAAEIKQHIFFKDINWDTVARQKAAFIPSDEQFLPSGEVKDYSDADSLSGSSGCSSNRSEEGEVEESNGHAEFESGVPIDYSFSNFSFKNLSQLASINYDLLSKRLE